MNTLEEPRFPQMQVKTLAKNSLQVPADLEGELNVALVAFRRWHQDLVDGWVPHLHQLDKELRFKLGVYEFPSLPESNFLYRAFLNSGMRAGIRNQYVFEHTIVLYTDLDTFTQQLGITSRETIEVLLIDKKGTILWRDRGAFNTEKLDSMRTYLDSYSG